MDDIDDEDIDDQPEPEGRVRTYFSQLAVRERQRFVQRIATLNEHVRRLAVQLTSYGYEPFVEPEAIECPPAVDRASYEARIRQAEGKARELQIALDTNEQERVRLRVELMRLKQERAGELISAKAAVRRGSKPAIVPKPI